MLVITYLVVVGVACSTARGAVTRPPGWWLRQAACIHHYETRGYPDPGAWHIATGNGYYGGLQFLVSTWRSAGGHGLPSAASPREQLYRAWLVWRRDGGSWSEWGTAGLCGLR